MTNELLKSLSFKEAYILRNALLEYVRKHHCNDSTCSCLINGLNMAVSYKLINSPIKDRPKKNELTREEKILSEKLKLADGGKPAQTRFFNTAIKKIEEAKSVSYADFRANFACETLIGVGFCNRKCSQCKLNEAHRKVVGDILAKDPTQAKISEEFDPDTRIVSYVITL